MKYLLASALVLTSGVAHSFCMEPTAPRVSVFAVEPSAPFCLSGFKYSGKHSCSRYDLDRYKSEVEDFIRQMTEYGTQAQAAARKYATEAQDYAVCRANSAVEEYNSAFK
ncbi:MAG: hypothetical protein Q7V09_04970 [Hydrogenophaga sp.]|uniref:hypothetical protein n=1 Tax=Hydrogenophaga sp. TaxID=1904254 RepID=UPI0027240798|nr:hypothetical protein [Hydrogenophaga sp.]MDO9029763.1 hypothetical protein [Hydrogenophaga sp.]